MPDVVVTVPKNFRHPGSSRVGLGAWIDEGDAAGQPWGGQLWAFYLQSVPDIQPGERVYVVCNGRLRGYASLIQCKTRDLQRRAACALIRGGDAVAVTIPERITGFMGFRYRWWSRDIEVAFPNWQEA